MRCTLELPPAAMFPSDDEQRRPLVPEGAAVSPEPLHQAVDLLSRGAVVAMPTDTQYALSAVATNREAVAAVFKIKHRPAFENLPIFIPSVDWLERVAEQPPERVRGLAERVWPGAVTLILPRNPSFYTIAVHGDTIALRIPDHPVALQILRELDQPLTGTSANLHGQPAALTPEDVREQLRDAVHIVAPGPQLPAGAASTILDLAGPIPRVLRQGPALDPRIGDWLVEHWGIPEPDAAGA